MPIQRVGDLFTGDSTSTGGTIASQASSNYLSPHLSLYTEIKKNDSGVHPFLYFKYIKSKFKTLERVALEKRLKVMEAAFNEAVDAGQEALGEKIMLQMAVLARESVLYAKGFRHVINTAELFKHKQNIRGGHISDTLLKDYTRLIPKNVLKRLQEAKPFFDDFVIFHYWNPDGKDVKKMPPEEKAKMKDPVLFGFFKRGLKGDASDAFGSSGERYGGRLYLIADWQDEHCDLSFDELVDEMGKTKQDVQIPAKPKLEF